MTKTIKVLLIGDSGVGKSSLMLSFTTGAFDEDISATIGIDFKTKMVDVISREDGERKQITMQLWDTAGQERFRTLTSSYYRGAHAVVLVYDVNEPQSFYGVSKWLEEANEYCQKDDSDTSVVYLLIGNKTDICSSQADMPVTKTMAQDFASEHHMLFALTSAKTRHGVAQAFDEVARAVYDKIGSSASRQTGSARKNLKNGDTTGQNGGGCC